MKTILVSASAILLLFSIYKLYRYQTKETGIDGLLRKGAILLDVRTPTEYNSGHLPGAINIPLSRLHADRIPLDPDQVYITVCSHGLRSVKAMKLLQEKGYQVHNGGAWTDLRDQQ